MDDVQDGKLCTHHKRGKCLIGVKAVFRPRRATPDFINVRCSTPCKKYEEDEEKVHQRLQQMKHPDCIHYGKGGWCSYRKGINADYTKNPPVKKFVKIRCTEVHAICGGCEYYKKDYKD